MPRVLGSGRTAKGGLVKAAPQSLAQRLQLSANSDSLLKSFERHLKAENKRQPTIAHYLGAARQFSAFCQAEQLPDLTEVTREHVEFWLERLHETYRPYSVKNRFVGLRVFFKWLREEDEIGRDPTARIKMPE